MENFLNYKKVFFKIINKKIHLIFQLYIFFLTNILLFKYNIDLIFNKNNPKISYNYLFIY